MSPRRALTAGQGAYMRLPPHRAGGFTSCLPGGVAIGFLFCVGFGAPQSKSIGVPVLRGHGRLRFGL